MTDIHPFDLQSRAALAIQGLTALLDQERDGLMYFLGEWRARPPRAIHGLWDCGDGCGRHVDALTLGRAMLPKNAPLAAPNEGERQLDAWMLRFLGDDGLTWLSPEPWAEPWGANELLAAYPAGRRWAEVSWAQRSTLMGLTTRYLATGSDLYADHARRLVDGLTRSAVRHTDGCYFPEGYYSSAGWQTRETGLFSGVEEYNAVIVAPLVRLYAATHYEPALALADDLVRFALKHSDTYHPDGTFRTHRMGEFEAAHFHTRTSFLYGVLLLGLETGRRELVAWARQGYAHARTWGTDFGWFPEGIGQRHGEICCTTDMLELALLLGEGVSPTYYADAERFGRNHLLESQYLSRERLQAALDRLPPIERSGAPGPFETDERVAERQVGAFASRPTLNDAFHLDATAFMQCCNAAALRGLYDLWHHAVAFHNAGADGLPEVQVNLRLSVESAGVRVVSHEPAEGRLQVSPGRACHLSVRLPEGVRCATIALNGPQPSLRHAQIESVYAQIDLAAEQSAELFYELPERTATYRVGMPGRWATCLGNWRGETLMAVDPEGAYLPLYQSRCGLPPVEPLPAQGPEVSAL
ncbi:MAG: hypothetical protein ACYC5M_11000 [Anaerolineae bacterium]